MDSRPLVVWRDDKHRLQARSFSADAVGAPLALRRQVARGELAVHGDQLRVGLQMLTGPHRRLRSAPIQRHSSLLQGLRAHAEIIPAAPGASLSLSVLSRTGVAGAPEVVRELRGSVTGQSLQLEGESPCVLPQGELDCWVGVRASAATLLLHVRGHLGAAGSTIEDLELLRRCVEPVLALEEARMLELTRLTARKSAVATHPLTRVPTRVRTPDGRVIGVGETAFELRLAGVHRSLTVAEAPAVEPAALEALLPAALVTLADQRDPALAQRLRVPRHSGASARSVQQALPDLLAGAMLDVTAAAPGDVSAAAFVPAPALPA